MKLRDRIVRTIIWYRELSEQADLLRSSGQTQPKNVVPRPKTSTSLPSGDPPSPPPPSNCNCYLCRR